MILIDNFREPESYNVPLETAKSTVVGAVAAIPTALIAGTYLSKGLLPIAGLGAVIGIERLKQDGSITSEMNEKMGMITATVLVGIGAAGAIAGAVNGSKIYKDHQVYYDAFMEQKNQGIALQDMTFPEGSYAKGEHLNQLVKAMREKRNPNMYIEANIADGWTPKDEALYQEIADQYKDHHGYYHYYDRREGKDETAMPNPHDPSGFSMLEKPIYGGRIDEMTQIPLI